MFKNEKLSLAFALILLAVAGYAIYELSVWTASLLERVNPSVGAALIAAAATVVSSVFIASYNSRKAREKVAFEAHREKKAEVYND